MDETKKQIVITGTYNRYQIKKLNKPLNPVRKKRDVIKKWNLTPEYFTIEKQFDMLSSLNHQIQQCYEPFLKRVEHNQDNQIILHEIHKKINGYKQQDVNKLIYDKDNFIIDSNVINSLVDCEMNCFFCKSKMFILYELVREMKQWTVDRIDNNLGHNQDNFILACLECNLKRRCQTTEKFLFTKQLNIVKLLTDL